MSSPSRHIAHLDLDSFYVSAEVLRNPALKGKPVLIGGATVRGVVASCSYEARKFGIHSAMAMKIARRLCPEAIIVPVDMELYVTYSSLVTQILRDSVPLFEKASVDEFYIDLTGMERFFGSMEFMRSIKKKIVSETGLPLTFALSSSKLVSKMATNEVKPDGEIAIAEGEEKAFLAPLSVSKIPGVGEKTAEVLRSMGLSTIELLREYPLQELQNRMGKSGTELWRRAHAIDDSPVIPYREQKSISTENTFHEDTSDLGFLHAEIVRMAEKIAFDLRSHNRLTGCVTVKLKYENFEVSTRQKTIAYTNSDHILIEAGSELFRQLYEPGRAVRLMGLRLSNLIPGNRQIDLFEDTVQMIHLYEAIDSVKKKFGESLLIKAAGMRNGKGENEE